MKENIQNILDELITLDPALKGRERLLAGIIEKLIAERPDTKFDENFARSLRSSILSGDQIIKPSKGIFFMFNKFAYAALAVIVLAVLAGAVYLNQPRTSPAPQTGSHSLALRVFKVSDDAFGSLANLKAPGAPTATGLGGGGGGSPTIPNPFSVQYKFVYHGDPLELLDSKTNVLKKSPGAADTAALISALAGQNSGMVDLSRFSDLKLQSFSVYEDRPDGYVVSVDLRQGVVNLNEQNPDNRIYELGATKASQLPPDAELVGIAKNFLNTRNIALDNYGEGEVQKYWRTGASSTAEDENQNLYEISVVFPLVIEGRTVYDQGGNKYGISVNVRLADRKVTAVWNVSLQQYQSSAYAAETDSTRILEIAQRGGLYGGLYSPESGANTVEISLGKPEMAYMQFWQYQNGQSSELLIPALVFPVLSQPDTGQFIQKNVVVPLAKEILDNASQPAPMPLTEKAR